MTMFNSYVSLPEGSLHHVFGYEQKGFDPCPVKALGRMRTQQETPKTASATNGAFTNNQRFSLETGTSLELFGYVAT